MTTRRYRHMAGQKGRVPESVLEGMDNIAMLHQDIYDYLERATAEFGRVPNPDEAMVVLGSICDAARGARAAIGKEYNKVIKWSTR